MGKKKVLSFSEEEKKIQARYQAAKALSAYWFEIGFDKITIVNDIIDLGNDTRVRNFKSQALREPKFIQEAQKNFPKMEEMFEKLRSTTRQEVNLKQIAATREAANQYKAAMESFLKNWLALQEVGKKRQSTVGLDKNQNKIAQNDIVSIIDPKAKVH